MKVCSQNAATCEVGRLERRQLKNAAGVVRLRIPDGFCPPFQCQSGIIANSTMHHTNAMTTHVFSARCAGFHQLPFGESSPVCVSMCMSLCL